MILWKRLSKITKHLNPCKIVKKYIYEYCCQFNLSHNETPCTWDNNSTLPVFSYNSYKNLSWKCEYWKEKQTPLFDMINDKAQIMKQQIANTGGGRGAGGETEPITSPPPSSPPKNLSWMRLPGSLFPSRK